MKLIVGLGNPGSKYKNTRHNLGFMAVEALAGKLGLSWRENKRFKSLSAGNGNMLLLKPQTYMNLSGEAVAAALSYYKLLPSVKGRGLAATLIVIHDDLDIDFGEIKVAAGSRSAGHNGVQSIIDRIGTNEFRRYRIGIRADKTDLVPPRRAGDGEPGRAEKFVLSDLSRTELKSVEEILSSLADSIIKNDPA